MGCLVRHDRAGGERSSFHEDTPAGVQTAGSNHTRGRRQTRRN